MGKATLRFGLACVLIGIIAIWLNLTVYTNELWIFLGSAFFIVIGIAFVGLWIVERIRKGSFIRT